MAAPPERPGRALAERPAGVWLVAAVEIALLLILAEGAARVWRPLGVVAYAIILAFAVLLAVGVRLPRDTAAHTPAENLLLASIAAIVAAFAFAQLSPHLQALAGGFESVGAASSYVDWLRFGVDRILEGLTFDLPSAFGWKLSPIEPAAGWARALTFLYVKCMHLAVLKALFVELQLLPQPWRRRIAGAAGRAAGR